MTFARLSLRPAISAAVLALAALPVQAVVVFDSLSNAVGISGVSTVSAPIASQGNRYTGLAINLANFSSGDFLTEIRVPLVNTTGAAFTDVPTRLRVWLWNTVNLAVSPVYSDSASGSAAPSVIADLGDVSLANNTLTVVTITLTTPIALTPTVGTSLGISFNYQLDTGAGFVDVTGVNTGVMGGATQTAGPLAGTNMFAGANGGYFRSANTDTDLAGNFSSTSSRNIGLNSGIPLMLITIPEPGTSVIAFAGLGLLIMRRRRD